MQNFPQLILRSRNLSFDETFCCFSTDKKSTHSCRISRVCGAKPNIPHFFLLTPVCLPLSSSGQSLAGRRPRCAAPRRPSAWRDPGSLLSWSQAWWGAWNQPTHVHLFSFFFRYLRNKRSTGENEITAGGEQWSTASLVQFTVLKKSLIAPAAAKTKWSERFVDIKRFSPVFVASR